MDGGGVTVVESVFVGQCRHCVANHIDIVAARRAPCHPIAPRIIGNMLAEGKGLELRVLSYGILFEFRDGVWHGNFGDVCLADGFLAYRE